MEEQNYNQIIKLNNVNDNTMSLNYMKINKRMFLGWAGVLIVLAAIQSLLEQSLDTLYASLILLGVVIILILFSDRKIVFIKNESENALIAKVYNYFRCRKQKKIFNYLNTIQFDVKTIFGKNENSYKLFIFNNLSRLQMIDLDKSDIKTKPLNLYYYFEQLDASISQVELNTQLNKFTNSSTEYAPPIFFNAEKYLSSIEDNPHKNNFYDSSRDEFSNIMRFSKYFYTYHVRDPNENAKKKNVGRIILLF